MHGATLFDEILEVPLILAAPGHDPAVVSAQVRLVDVMPTLLELADAPLDGLDGESLLPLPEEDRPAVAVRTDKGALSEIAVRIPPWKLILDLESGTEQGYRLDLDPREREPRTDAPQELRDRLHAELEGVPRERSAPKSRRSSRNAGRPRLPLMEPLAASPPRTSRCRRILVSARRGRVDADFLASLRSD
jgi:arylsulfatase A-like enzyme